MTGYNEGKLMWGWSSRLTTQTDITQTTSSSAQLSNSVNKVSMSSSLQDDIIRTAV